ncbi:MAG TPA: imidazoleglycerol-phosphate dehydratase HisB [Acidimicrobiia bacterium]|nr:imidazoleglycerol-phosphate dehydratase HisB [Acidimicrobiia bacterium]
MRSAELSRATAETNVEVSLDVDGSGQAQINTGLGFFDHMVSTLARHSSIDLVLGATGDLGVDDHHTVEDCAIVLGRALDEALGDRRGVARFGHAYAPLDESLARSVIDLSGRPWAEIDLGLRREMIGEVSTENLTHFLRSLAIEARMTLHVDVLRGDNDHHRAEAAFKAIALALRQAVAVHGIDVPSTKGVLG